MRLSLKGKVLSLAILPVLIFAVVISVFSVILLQQQAKREVEQTRDRGAGRDEPEVDTGLEHVRRDGHVPLHVLERERRLIAEMVDEEEERVRIARQPHLGRRELREERDERRAEAVADDEERRLVGTLQAAEHHERGQDGAPAQAVDAGDGAGQWRHSEHHGVQPRIRLQLL